MKISTKGRYGLRFMLDLALRQGERPIALREIAERMGVSEKYLWQIITPLKAGGLIRSAAGARGGYELARKPETITARDILHYLEGAIQLAPCKNGDEKCSRGGACAAEKFWKGLEAVIQGYLASTDLRQLADAQRQIEETNPVTYCI